MALLEAYEGLEFTAVIEGAPAGLAGTIGLTIFNDANAVVTPRSVAGIVESPEGTYTGRFTAPKEEGSFYVEWTDKEHEPAFTTKQDLLVKKLPLEPSDEGSMIGEEPPESPDLTDLWVLVPKAKRACEGPYGAPEGRPELRPSQVYEMVADGCGQIILASGSLFRHELIVKARHPQAGYPTRWKTDVLLTEWEGALITTQTALDYFFFLFRDMKISQTIKNEGTEWTYSLSANVVKNYLESLKAQRDLALKGLREHNPPLDKYASNIRVRDQLTVGILEWWDTVSPGLTGSVGVPGGQEAAVIPWTAGWNGEGFTP